MKIVLRLPALLLFLALAIALPAQPSPNPRIAVVDVQAVLTTSTAGQMAFEKLKRMQDERMTQAKAMDDKLRQLEAAATKGAAANTAELQRQIADQRKANQRHAEQADREISEARDRELAALEAKIKPVIDALAAEMGIDAIFNKFESGLVFASPRLDITEAIVKRFNAQK